MTAEQLCYWLQGFAELNVAPPTPEQWDSIREHLALVFNKVTKPVANPAAKPKLNPESINDIINKNLARPAAPSNPPLVGWPPSDIPGGYGPYPGGQTVTC